MWGSSRRPGTLPARARLRRMASTGSSGADVGSAVRHPRCHARARVSLAEGMDFAYTMRRFAAQRVSSLRLESWSLRSTFETCVSIVLTERCSRAAISLYV
jgi:hypothetical protein